MNASVPEPSRLALERDLFRRLLELGAQDDLRPFLEAAVSLIVEVTGAQKGYLELRGGARAPRLFIARGFSTSDLDGVRRALSGGIIAQALASGRTVSTASAIDDPRFAGQASVQAARIQAVLCAPIGGASGLGVLYLQGRPAPGPFSEDDRIAAELFARHLAPQADRLLASAEAARASDHTADLRARLAVERLAGCSRALAEVFRQVAVAAPVSIPVLLTGESGTGKTAIARAIHESSPRKAGPFVEVNCAAVPETLFESELFGAEAGAHSTATRATPGLVGAAQRGTLLLDEIGEMPLSVQAKLLGFLQSRRYHRLGNPQPIEADVRVVAATNADLEELMRRKRFREDLFYRLNVISIRVPPLRERPEDVGAIAEAALRGIGEREGRMLQLSTAGRLAIAEAEWPGNVRQLENAVQRGWAGALADGSGQVEPWHLFPGRPRDSVPGEPAGWQEATRRFQQRLLAETLATTGWNVSEAARKLDLARSRVNELIRAFGLTRDEVR